MKLKSLDIHGFKSFADKTTLEFHEGVTGVVGPNGCGKSNVVDAIRWVLGETSAKALRGGEMADVIFNGTDTRKASAMAAVSLNFTDCEKALETHFNEVSITRRVYKDGKSEYRINNTLCRLRDIHDLFLDTGIGRSAYSIMEQGKIDQLLSSKPEDRRVVFEEAAGVSKFKKEKKEALRKLEQTSANLLRVSDIMEEQERRLTTLKRQASKAQRHKELSDDFRILETHLIHQEYRELLAGRNHLKHSLEQLTASIKTQEAVLPGLEVQLLTLREHLTHLQQTTTEYTKSLNDAHAEIQKNSGQLKLNAERREDLQHRTTRNREEIAESQTKITTHQADLNRTLKQVEQLRIKIATQQTALSECQEQVTQIRKERDTTEHAQKEQKRLQINIERKVASLRAQLEGYRTTTANNTERIQTLTEEERHTLNTLSETETSLNHEIEKVTLHKGKQPHLEELKEAAQKTLSQIKIKREKAHQALRAEQQELATHTSRLEALEHLIHSGEGLGEGAQAVLSGIDNPALYQPLLGGTLGTHFTTADSYIPAIEAAMGGYMHAILTSETTAAISIIETLREKELGTATLLVTATDIPSSTPPLPLPSNAVEAVGWAYDLLTIHTVSLQPLLKALLSSTLVVPDLKTAAHLQDSFPHLRYITLAGEILTPEGFLNGGKGNDSPTSSLRLQNEIAELKIKSQQCKTRLTETENDINNLTHTQNEASTYLDTSQLNLQKHRYTENALQSTLVTIRHDLTSQKRKLSHIQTDQKSLLKRQKEADTTLEALTAELDESQNIRHSIEQELQKIATSLTQIRQEEEQAFQRLSEQQTTVAVDERTYDNLQHQRKPLEIRITELLTSNVKRESELITFADRITASHLKDQELRDLIGNNEASVKQHSAKLTHLKLQIDTTRTEIHSTETALTEARKELLTLTEKRGREDVELTKLDLTMENLTTAQRDKHQIELPTFIPAPPLLRMTLYRRLAEAEPPQLRREEEELICWEEVERTAHSLRQKLDRMGTINGDAIAEYKELEERHSFIRSQYDDLTSSKDELLKIIEKINTETTKLFSETFSVIRTNFQNLFKQLFGDRGKADLILANAEDPLESGIDIIAKPPGKKLQSITLLSGGERSMTAVALLFSIYMVKPSPFCVLDELDAPLDESNISRFLNLLDHFIQQSQFIIITHNKRTMARADVLYGVTMPELGVSKPIGMILSQATGDDKSL